MGKSKTEKVFVEVTSSIIILFLYSWVFMILWNYIIPDIFGLKVITYFKAMAFFMCVRVLVGRARIKDI